ncbi:MAG: hypothetical protein NC548_22795 [Lachnospiraceae bacterium]|nr:hypothetical protein [Lachnospiraceae bacterium]
MMKATIIVYDCANTLTFNKYYNSATPEYVIADDAYMLALSLAKKRARSDETIGKALKDIDYVYHIERR